LANPLMMPDFLARLGFLVMFLDLIALVSGLVLMVLLRAKDALDLNLGLDCLALILLATSMGFIQVAGSATTLPLRGPDVHLNLRFKPLDPLLRPNICRLPSSSTGLQSNNSQNFIVSVFSLRCYSSDIDGYSMSTTLITHKMVITVQITKMA